MRSSNCTLLTLVSLSLSVAACTNSTRGTGPDGDDPSAAEKPASSLTFGETDEEVSANASEMMAKSASNPDPTTLAGLYERTDFASEDRPSDYLVIANDVRVRVEIRRTAIAVAIECDVKVGGRVDDQKVLLGYAASPIEVYPWGIRIQKAVAAKDSWSTYDVSCELALPDEDWPYCVHSEIPDGYSTCVYMESGRLRSRGVGGAAGEVGKKIRN